MLFATAVLLGACAGGGGGGGSGGGGSSGGGGTGGGTPQPPPPMITFAEPRPPSMGVTPAPAQQATNANKNFDGAAPIGTTFPLMQVIMQANTIGGKIVPVAADYDTSLTFTNLGFRFEGLGLKLEVPGDGTPASGPNEIGSEIDTVRLVATAYHYFFGGLWSFEAPGYVNFSPFVAGYVTPNNAIPTGGNATYSRIDGVIGDVLISKGTELVTAGIEGDVTLNVEFASIGGLNSGTLTGTFTNVEAVDEMGNRTPWNNVSLNGSARGGNAQVTSAPSAPYALESGATGMFGGDIYGPNADEIGAVWYLRNADGSAFAEGIFGADKGFTFSTPPAWMMSLIAYGNTWVGWWGNNQIPNPNLATPAAASEGSSPPPSPVATKGGPRLDGSGSSPADLFPLTMTSMMYSKSGLSVDQATNTGGATLTVTETQGQYAPWTDYRLVIPNLGIDYVFHKDAHFSQPGMASTSGVQSYELSTFGLSYTGFGRWMLRGAPGDPGVAVGHGMFVFGYETPSGSMPSNGTAAYKGTGTVAGIVDVANPAGKRALVGGDANLTANFGTGQISGTLTNMIATPDGETAQPWNNVSVSASIATGTNNFSGSTSPATAPVGTYSLKSTAKGHIDGGFYGPAANELGAVWSLSNGDGTGAALGIVGATKQ